MVLEGTFLIELPPGCEFKTNNEAFINSKTTIKEEPLTLPKIRTKEEKQLPKTKPLKLDNLPLDELHKLTKEEDRLESIEPRTWTTSHSHFWITPIYILITISLIFGGYKIKQLWKKKDTPIETVTEDSVQKPVLFVPYKTSSGDGDITV